MGKWLLLLGGLMAAQAQAQAPETATDPPVSKVVAAAPSTWFTVMGSSRNAAANTVEVNPVAINDAGDVKTMRLRVNRTSMRRNWEGVPYRSYESEVEFDCRARRAHYVVATFYMAPLWQGDPHQTTDYTRDPRPMLFRDMEPNPTERILRAACRTAGN